MKKSTAVAYFRTSSATNVGGDSEARQRQAVEEYAKRNGIDIVRSFYDAAVSGADPIDARPGFCELLDYMASNGARTILVENASRFARDLAVQIAGHQLLQQRGFELVPVDAPDHFRDETPTATMVRQILGAVAEFEKASTVAKLKAARDRKRAATGRCEGRPAVPDEVVAQAKRLARKPIKGKPRSLRAIAQALAEQGHMSPSGKPYHAQSVKQMLER
jgi:DNA invertase Pin-like site-specific DNA recombinase